MLISEVELDISVVGLGFVGTVTAGCLADAGHALVGVDIDSEKVSRLNDGRASFHEPEINDLLERNRSACRLEATLNIDEAIAKSDISMICVDVGNDADGIQDTRSLTLAAHSVGKAIARKGKFHRVVIRSTVLPSTTRDIVLPILEDAIGEPVGVGFGLAHNPEFMREGSGVSDFRTASRVVVGAFDRQTFEVLAVMYHDFCTLVFDTTPEISEAIKYVDNVWHAVKVSFANEIASVCNARKIDTHALMDVFRADRQLNISEAYLKPGFGFGGSCLPKDLKAMTAWSDLAGLDLPLLSNVNRSNQRHIERSVEWLLDRGGSRYAIFGLAYKPGISDMRGSPFVQIVHALLAESKRVRVFDPCVAREDPKLLSAGAPGDRHGGIELALDLQELIGWCDTIVLCTKSKELEEVWQQLPADKIILDFSGISDQVDGRIRRFV